MTTGFELSKKMMPYVCKTIARIPAGIFFGIETATFEQDTTQATDLILKLSGGNVAVRVRNFNYVYRHWQTIDKEPLAFDWSVRFQTRTNHRTEIDKLRDGFGRWYFMAVSNEDETDLWDWGIIDLDKCREIDLFDNFYWQINSNGDGSAGGYMAMRTVQELNCLIYSKW